MNSISHRRDGSVLFHVISRILLLACVGLISFGLMRAGDAAPAEKTYTGVLATGIMSIGGETTGNTLTTKDDGTYELDFGKHTDLQQLAEKLNGKKVTVTGIYAPKEGVEVKTRRIVEVKSLKEAK